MGTRKFNVLTRLLIFSALALGLAACGGGGGGGGGGSVDDGVSPPIADDQRMPVGADLVCQGPIFNNLALRSLKISTNSDSTIGYPLTVEFALRGENVTPDVSVDFYAIEKGQNEPQQIPLGTTTYDLVPNRGFQSTNLNLPATVMKAGTYYIGMIIDPINAICEWDENDNTGSFEVTLEPMSPNIFIENETATLGRKSILLDATLPSLQTEVIDTNGTATIEMRAADGTATIIVSAQALTENIDVQAFASLRITDNNGGVVNKSLHLWNPEIPNPGSLCETPSCGQYTDASSEWLPIGSLEPTQVIQGDKLNGSDMENNNIHLGYAFPDGLALELIDGINQGPPINEYAICMAIRTADNDFTDRFADDNEICRPISLVPPPDPIAEIIQVPPGGGGVPLTKLEGVDQVFYDYDWHDSWGGKYLGYDLNFYTSTQVDETGLIMSGEGVLPIHLIGTTYPFFSASGKLEQFGDSPDPNITVDVELLGVTLVHTTNPKFESPSLVFSFSKEKVVDLGKFWVGPVPMKLEASVAGESGIEFELDLSLIEVKFTQSPFAELLADLKAESDYMLFNVGAAAEVSVVKTALDRTSKYSVNVNTYDDNPAGTVKELVIKNTEAVDIKLTGPTGRGYLYVSYSVPTLKRCSWGFFDGVCPGFDTVSLEQDILGPWTAYQAKYPLAKHVKDLRVFTVNNGSPQFYTTN